MAVLSQSGQGTTSQTGQYVTLKLAQLRVGSRLRSPIWEDVDDRDVMLLSSGTSLTRQALAKLIDRGVTKVRVHRNEVMRLTGGNVSHLRQPLSRSDSPLEDAPVSRWGVSADSYVHRVTKHGSAPYDRSQATRVEAEFKASAQMVDRLFQGMAAGNLDEAPDLAAVSTDSLVKIAADMDLFIALGLTPGFHAEHGRHSLQTAMMSLSIGTMLGLKRDDLIELGVGCLIHDAGMLRLRVPVLETPRPLSPLEFLEVTKHPAITYDLLNAIPDVRTGARMVAYQMHERCDGSGYPRRRRGSQIHPLARIAAVADVFVALVSPRPWRKPLTPYRAMECIIRDARVGLLDPQVVRALLHAVSLFPIGSFVETNDGRVGKVVRSNRDQYTKPIIELWQPNGMDTPEIVDLSNMGDVFIARTLDVPPAELALPEPNASSQPLISQAPAIPDDWE